MLVDDHWTLLLTLHKPRSAPLSHSFQPPILTMVVHHIVAFKYNSELTPSNEKAMRDRMFELKQKCVLETKEPYILKIVAGHQNSDEGYDKGMQVCVF